MKTVLDMLTRAVLIVIGLILPALKASGLKIAVCRVRYCPSASRMVLCLSLIIPLQVWAGSPFYLTAERSFSDTESPSLRLDYTATDQPMLIRVLKPKNLDSMLDGQFNISRSYEQPISELNPGYYFAKGINAAQSPLKLFRGMLNTEFRKSLKGTPFSGAVKNISDKALVSPPQQILVSAPKAYQVIKESYLDLQHNGEDAQDLGWWFGQDAWSEYRYKVRQISLDPLADGIYLIQAVQGKTEAQCLIQVSSLAVQVKQSSQQLLVRVIDRKLQAVAGAKVSYRDARGRWQPVTGVTDANGELQFQNPEGVLDGRLLVRVDAAGSEGISTERTALTSTDFLPTQANVDEVFVLTDRPIFKPGETFHYKGIVRSRQDGQLQIPGFQSGLADVSLILANGKPTGLHTQNGLSDFGSFSGSFDLDSQQAPGLYRLLAEIDQKPYAGEFRVRDYVKPNFYLEWLDKSAQVMPGQPFSLKFRAKRYSGGIPQNVKYEVFLYRKKFEAPQFVLDAGAGLAAGNDYFGQIKSVTPLTQPQRIYSSIEVRQAAELSNPWETAAKLEQNGEGTFEFTVPANSQNLKPDIPDQEWIYSLMVRAQDQSGGNAILTDNIYATLSEAQPALSFNKTIAELGDSELHLFIQSSYADGKPAANAGGVVELMLDQPGTKKHSLLKLDFATDQHGQQILKLPALQEYGRISATASLETLADRRISHPAKSQTATLVVAGHAGEAIADNQALELYTARTVLSPGEHAKVFAMLPEAWGNQESGKVWQTVAGERIFANTGEQVQGRSHWFEITAQPEYGTGFYHTVTVPVAGGKFQEQTLGFRVVPWEKRLQIAIQPEKAETEPLKPTRIRLEVKRADGRPAAETELAVSVVDRAVYAVQAEFRPGIFDFFYPLQRNNLATFYSDELQGYGYADLLRKPNFSLSALKSQSKLAKKSMRDTAGWFPHVITDANGVAVIDVAMPANITEWLVTAVASDKQGRLGENTNQFRTVTDVSVDMVGPQFLREGDAVQVGVKLNNHLQTSVKLAGNISIPANLQLQQGELNPQAEMPAKGELVWPLLITALDRQNTAALEIGLSVPDSVRVGGAEAFEIPLQTAALRQIISSSGQENLLRLDLPEQAFPHQLRVRVNSGLLGAALQSAAMLVQYPYGCTEQLAHSTVPNLVLMDLLERAGVKLNQLGPLTEVLNRARHNAALGMRKLIQNQKADGGFALWPGDSSASLPVTLIAMQALKYADELKLEGVNNAYNKGLEWLANHVETDMKGDGFLLSGLTKVGYLYRTPWEQQAYFVDKIAADSSANAAELISALQILQAYQQQPWHSFSQHFQQNPDLKPYLIKRLQTALDRIDPANLAQNQIGEAYRQLGFNAGLPGLIAAGLGVLHDAEALPPALMLKLKRQLLQSQVNGYWQSTYDSAVVIFNTRKLLSEEAASVVSAKARKLTVSSKDGQILGALEPMPGGYQGDFIEFGSQPELGEITLSNLSSDEIASASLSVDVPYPAVSARSTGITIARRFLRIEAKGSSLIDMSQSLKPGDIIVSEVMIKRSSEIPTAHASSEFIVVEDAIPSVAEGLENDQTYLADAAIQTKQDSYWANIKQTQRFPDRIVRVVRLGPGAELSLYQVWRVDRPGNAAISPATGVDMYNQAIQGNSIAARVTVAQ